MRAEPPVDLLVPSLADEMQVEVPYRREEGVRVADRVLLAAGVGDSEHVVERRLDTRDEPFPHALADVLELDPVARRQTIHPHRLGLGPQHANGDAAVGRVGAEEAVGVREVERRARARHAGTSVSSRRRIPATGMSTHPGRLFRS